MNDLSIFCHLCHLPPWCWEQLCKFLKKSFVADDYCIPTCSVFKISSQARRYYILSPQCCGGPEGIEFSQKKSHLGDSEPINRKTGA